MTPDPQSINATLTADPSTGNASLPVGSGQTLFQSAADVEVYPIAFPNGGATGSVVVTANDPNASVDATLFRRDNSQSPWVPIATQSGSGALTLAVTPAQGEDLADSNFQLAVAPLNFASAAGAYQISVASATLAPTSVDPTTAVPFSSVLVPAIGTVRSASADPLTGTAKLYTYQAQTTGQATITLAATGFAPLVSVYDSTGTKLLDVSSLTSPGTVSFQLPVTAGSTYLVRIDAVGGSPTGSTQLTVDSSYTTTPLSFGITDVTSVNGITVGPTAGSSFLPGQPRRGHRRTGPRGRRRRRQRVDPAHRDRPGLRACDRPGCGGATCLSSRDDHGQERPIRYRDLERDRIWLTDTRGRPVEPADPGQSLAASIGE